MKKHSQRVKAALKKHRAPSALKKHIHSTSAQRHCEVKKHQHIWILLKSGVRNKNVMKLAHCNPGEIQNVKRMYRKNRSKIKEAQEALFAC